MKDVVQRTQRQAAGWEKIFTDQISKDLYREYIKLKNICMTNIILVISEVKLKITVSYHTHLLIRMAKIRKTDLTSCWPGCERAGTLYFAVETEKWCRHFRKQFGCFLKC